MTDVVLAVDDDERRAKLQARRVAALDWAADALHVTVFHVFGRNVEGASVGQVGAARRAREILEAAGIEVTLDEESGDPGEEVVEYAEEHDVDLICLAGRKRSPAGKAVFGSVSQSVMLETDRTVLFCPAEAE